MSEVQGPQGRAPSGSSRIRPFLLPPVPGAQVTLGCGLTTAGSASVTTRFLPVWVQISFL